jgi:hypothetical protein
MLDTFEVPRLVDTCWRQLRRRDVVWLNVKSLRPRRDAQPGLRTDKVIVELKTGSTVAAQVLQGEGDWGFRVRLADAALDGNGNSPATSSVSPKPDRKPLRKTGPAEISGTGRARPLKTHNAALSRRILGPLLKSLHHFRVKHRISPSTG